MRVNIRQNQLRLLKVTWRPPYKAVELPCKERKR